MAPWPPLPGNPLSGSGDPGSRPPASSPGGPSRPAAAPAGQTAGAARPGPAPDGPARPGTAGRDLVVALSPFEEPGERIVVAAERAGALGLLDLGRDADAARAALARTGRLRHGVRVPVGCPLTPADLPDEVDTVLLADPRAYAAAVPHAVTHAAGGTGPTGAVPGPDDWAGGGRRRVWAEITTPEEAAAACAAGATALVARGHESGGRVGELTTCVLLQRVLADPSVTVPVLAAGGIGPHTAAAAVAGGAAGVLLDSQLALTTEGEARLPLAVAAAIRAMDGSETTLVAGHRVLTRPDLTTPAAAGTAETGAGATGEDAGPARVAALLGARDLHAQLLPIGQDGAFAARLAARHRTTGGIVQAVRTGIAEHLAAAARTRPLAPRPGARHLPVAQGPMTRVSDESAFAAAVAAEGGLPFLALAVMDGGQVRRLLAETAERLGERPWGVGLLGFAPPELRREQLAAVAEFAPEYALIAGGRPAQAAPLEAAGTRTYLHVPAPGLLERYLAEGARRFVFEGQECGGHIGPRASFPLWEEQIERLTVHARTHGGTAEDLDLLFAGGIHDARSAAMAAAAAAPLAELGARIGVLMGTAYLFTQEAVATGAVLPGFQNTALTCDRTVLLRTAPGHATRCAETAYAEEFAAAEQRLAAQGTDPRARWEELERRNLGRLRLASKGLRHTDGGPPAPVGEPEQRREGLYMLGQAATARSAPTTVAALHTAVTEGATAQLTARAEQFRTPDGPPERDAEPLDIAIVGMACFYPGAADTARFWSNVVAGVDSVTEVPAERWDTGTYHDPDPARAGERTPSRWGGFLPAIPFDALAHGIPPASLTGIDPVQLLALEAAAKALADAGYADRDFDRTRTSVVFGAEAGAELAGAYGLRTLHPAYLGELPPGLDAELPRLTEDSFPGVLANVIAGRIASRLDLGGANCTVDAACASSLAALDLACRQLRDHDSDMALCGGADVHNGINDYLMFASVRALSPTGRCRPFDAAADGIALGEGVGALVLKRLTDAERDGDRVYAVIKAVGTSSDGRSLGLIAPRPEGQRRALERAYRRAGISPAQVGLLEAHGTGTVVGDTAELGVLTELFEDAGAAPGSCTLGSVKSQIGHTKCAAGLAGLIKAAHAVHTGVRPPTLHLTRPAADTGAADTGPFRFDAGHARPWPVPVGRRIAGVSAFGFGGTNYHAVLAGYDGAPEPAHALTHWPAELFCFRGADRPAAERAMERLAARLADNDAAGRPWPLRDLAAETAAGTGSCPALCGGRRPRRSRRQAGGRPPVRRRRGRVSAPAGRRPRSGLLPLPRPGEPTDRNARRVVPRLPRAARSAGRRRSGVGRGHVPAHRLHRRGAGRPAGRPHRHPRRPAGARPRLRRRTPAAHHARRAPRLHGGALLRRADRTVGRGRLRHQDAAPAQCPPRRGDPRGGRGRPRGDGRRRGHPGAGPGPGAGRRGRRRQSQCARTERDLGAHGRRGRGRGGIAQCRGAGEAPAGRLRLPQPATRRRPRGARRRTVRGTGVRARLPGLVRRHRAPLRSATPPRYASPWRTRSPHRCASWSRSRTCTPPGCAPSWRPGPAGCSPASSGTSWAAGRTPPWRWTCRASPDWPGCRTYWPGSPRPGSRSTRRPCSAGVRTLLPAAAPRRPGWLVDGHLVRTADGAFLPGGLRPARRVDTRRGDEGAAPMGGIASGTAPVRSGTAPGDVARQDAVLEYLRVSRELVVAQRDVVLQVLGRSRRGRPGGARRSDRPVVHGAPGG